jgi:hypothetical protein
MRVSISKEQQIGIFIRDSWHCRYCLQPMFFAPTLKLLENLSPGHSYYHRNGLTGKMLPLFFRAWASVDHIKPVALGGDNTDTNLIAACWKCNLDKSNSEIREDQIKAITDEIKNLGWDGLCSLYPKLSKPEDGWSRLIRKHYKI